MSLARRAPRRCRSRNSTSISPACRLPPVNCVAAPLFFSHRRPTRLPTKMSMSTNKKLEQLITQMENYLECWKQFNGFVNLARTKKFGGEDENQFLEIKSVIVQELELILASV